MTKNEEYKKITIKNYPFLHHEKEAKQESKTRKNFIKKMSFLRKDMKILNFRGFSYDFSKTI